MSAPVTRNLTILLTDIKGFTDKTSHQSRADIQDLLDRHKELVLPILEGKGGKLVKTIGDAFLMTFESPTDAVLAGVEVQEALRAYNADEEPARRIEIRIAINQGEVNLADNDVFGEPVNITARIEAIAEANEVFFTDAVYLSMNKTEVPSSEIGLLQFKGIPEKVRVYKVRRENPVAESTALPPVPGAARRLWDAVKPSVAGASAAAAGAPTALPVAASAAKPALSRRFAALAIDACLCWILIGAFGLGDRGEVRRRRTAAKAGAVSAGRAGADASVDEAMKRPSRFQLDCGRDLERFCGKQESTDGEGLVSCLKAHAESLSRACKADALMKPSSGDVRLGKDGLAVNGAAGRVRIGPRGLEVKSPEADLTLDKDGFKVNGKEVDFKGGARRGDGDGDEDAGEAADSDEDDSSLRVFRRRRGFPMFGLVWFIYSLVLVKKLGTTAGGRICKLAVVQHPGGAPLVKNQFALRAFFSVFSGYCAGLGYLWGLWEKDGRGWHDLIAGTRVVSTE